MPDRELPGDLLDQVARQLRVAGCVYAEAEARLLVEAAAGNASTLSRLVARRCAGEPLELVVGFAEFAGLRVMVEAGVFVPRQLTVGLVDMAVSLLRDRSSPVVVDLGCGSGALLMTLLHRTSCEAYAIDVSDAAVHCARANLRGTGAAVIAGDGFQILPERVRGRVDVVLANLPYVPTGGLELMPREARLYEPISALDGGVDGLEPFRAAVASLDPWLSPAGSYLCELYEGQVAAAAEFAGLYGYTLESTTDSEESGALVRLSRRS